MKAIVDLFFNSFLFLFSSMQAKIDQTIPLRLGSWTFEIGPNAPFVASIRRHSQRYRFNLTRGSMPKKRLIDNPLAVHIDRLFSSFLLSVKNPLTPFC